jgi:hypothetical protein
MIALPAMYLLGSLVMTWVTYGACYLLKDSGHPMQYGAVGSVLVFSTLVLPWMWLCRATWLPALKPLRHVRNWMPSRANGLEWTYVVCALLLALFIDFYTFHISQDTLHMGLTVWSDFGPHVAVIRSFSLGDNFPTTYPHFPADSIRYHFLFQFMAAVLETLGWRLDFAFNIPSTLSLVSLFMLLYALAVTITGQRWIGVLTGVLFFFRSSFAFFTFIKELIPGEQVLNGVFNVALHIGKTENEAWGLFTQNVYANQRHFAFSLSILILILLALLPALRQMVQALQQRNFTLTTASSDNASLVCRISTWWHVFLLNREAWLPQSWSRAIFLGVLLGALAFWNGAVVIAALTILFVLAIFSRHRIEFLIIAVLAIALSMLQSEFFIGTDSAVSPRLYFGFLAQYKTLLGVLAYYIELLGIFPLLLIIALFGTPKGFKWLAVALFSPLIMASTMALTTDINANHKFVMIGVMLANIFVAAFLYRLFVAKSADLKTLASVLLALLIVTGLVDFLTLFNMNKNRVTMELHNPLTQWTLNNTASHDVILTSTSVINPIQLAGRKIYYGWPYYAWSAGYDTDRRGEKFKQMYGATDAESLRKLVKQEGIAYILIDQDVRQNKDYTLNEALFRDTFPLAFENTEANQVVYRVK